MAARGDTRTAIASAARQRLLAEGYARLSTRKVADAAGVPLSQIHYHFGSKRGLIRAVLEAENERLLERQSAMYAEPLPLWKQWEQACDFLDDDVRSGYVRLLHEMVAGGWSDPELAAAVRDLLRGWYDLLSDVAARAEERLGGLGPFTAREVATLAGHVFLGAEAAILLGFAEDELPSRSALRKVAEVIRRAEEAVGA